MDNETENKDEKVKELDEKKAPKVEPKTETRVARLAGLFQAEIKNLADRVGALEGKTPAGSIEEEIVREEKAEEQENLFDEVGRRCAEILGLES